MIQASLFAPRLHERPIAKLRVGYLERSQILTRPTGSASIFDYSLNPYIGCGFGCSYCFASFFQPDQERFDSWGTWVDVKVRAAEDLLRKKDLKGSSVFMSSATDPYQPLEAKLELTRRILEVLVEPSRQPRLVVQTRGPLVSRDFDLLSQFEKVRLNMSITTDSEDIRRRFEPNCASIERRLETVAAARDLGIPTTICIAPMLPIKDARTFARRIADTGTTYVVTGGFRRSERPFAASTRKEALKLAEEYGWNQTMVDETTYLMKQHLPQLNQGPRGWMPE